MLYVSVVNVIVYCTNARTLTFHRNFVHKRAKQCHSPKIHINNFHLKFIFEKPKPNNNKHNYIGVARKKEKNDIGIFVFSVRFYFNQSCGITKKREYSNLLNEAKTNVPRHPHYEATSENWNAKRKIFWIEREIDREYGAKRACHNADYTQYLADGFSLHTYSSVLFVCVGLISFPSCVLLEKPQFHLFSFNFDPYTIYGIWLYIRVCLCVYTK